MTSPPSDSVEDASYPPLPESGPPEDSDFAQQNFTERERLSRSWRARLFSNRRAGITLLEKRSSILVSDSETSSSSISLDAKHIKVDDSLGEPWAITATAAVSEAGPSQHSESFASDRHTGPSQDTVRISLTNTEEEDPTKDEHLYRWAMVYENQRGISLFSTRRYSSQSLLPRDPPAFSIAAPASSPVNGQPVSRSHRPDISLADFPLPDGNWRWASKEWMIDMREETVQHDGFEYNWFFRSKNWRSKAGHLNAGAWVRRRRWLRLMERPPLSAMQQDEGIGRVAREPKVLSSVDLGEVWQGDDGDWSRLHRIMHELGRDGRKLEVWKEWISIAGSNGSGEASNHPATEFMATVLRGHIDDLMRSFVFPSSRIEFLEQVTRGGVLSEGEVLGISDSSPSFVDRSRLEEIIGIKNDPHLLHSS